MAWAKKIKRKYADLLKVAAELEDWNEEKFKENLDDQTSITMEEHPDLDEDVTALLRNITDGDAKHGRCCDLFRRGLVEDVGEVFLKDVPRCDGGG